MRDHMGVEGVVIDRVTGRMTADRGCVIGHRISHTYAVVRIQGQSEGIASGSVDPPNKGASQMRVCIRCASVKVDALHFRQRPCQFCISDGR